jgi:cation:H+ antiporter
MLTYFLLIVGLVILVVGGDILVRGAVSIAEQFSISPLIIGLTIVSLGTSAPELFISVQAALAGSGGLAIGNVVGSNIANVLLVLGLPALIASQCVKEKGIGRNIIVMLGITVIFMGMMATGSMGFFFGVVLVALLLLFLWDQYKSSLKSKEIPDYHDEVGEGPSSLKIAALFLLIGIIMLPFGAQITVDNAHIIALNWGLSDEIIGLTVIAIGTSLPELAASLMAVIRGRSNLAIGNVVGSNIFNIAAIMGITLIITPVAVGEHIIHLDMWIMFGVSLLLGAIAYFNDAITRWMGLVMLGLYTSYIALAFMN